MSLLYNSEAGDVVPHYKAVLSHLSFRAPCFIPSVCLLAIYPFTICISCLLHSNTSMLVASAWRKPSWKRVRTCSLCATPCLSTPRPQTNSSGSLFSHRMLRVWLQKAHTHTQTYMHVNQYGQTISHKNAFKELHWLLLLLRLMGLKRIICLQCWEKFFIHCFSELQQ